MKEFKRNVEDINGNNIEILYRLGTNAKENHQIIDEADKNDWWFHLDDNPSGHCIVEREIIDIDDVIFASNLVVKNSKLKNLKKVKLCYTQIKNLRKTKNPGEVKILKKPLIHYYKNE